MSFLEKLRNIDKETEEPIRQGKLERKDLEALIDIINVAKDCDFKLTLLFSIGSFEVESINFKGIKILNASKNEHDRVVITYSDALSTTDVTIPIQNVVGASLDLHLSHYGDADA